jgi:hypothetical protein
MPAVFRGNLRRLNVLTIKIIDGCKASWGMATIRAKLYQIDYANQNQKAPKAFLRKDFIGFLRRRLLINFCGSGLHFF